MIICHTLKERKKHVQGKWFLQDFETEETMWRQREEIKEKYPSNLNIKTLLRTKVSSRRVWCMNQKKIYIYIYAN